MGQDFKNHYESTKFQAEVWVRELMDAVPTTILRPAIVVGDSRTGETEKFDGPYYSCARSRARSGGPRRAAVRPLRARRSTSSRSTSSSRRSSPPPATTRRAGETLHLVDPEPLTARELVDAALASYAGRAPAGRIPPALVEAPAHQRGARAVRRHAARSRSPTSTTPCVSTPGARSTCSRRTAWCRRASATTWSDGRVLPRARGRPGATAEAASAG